MCNIWKRESESSIADERVLLFPGIKLLVLGIMIQFPMVDNPATCNEFVYEPSCSCYSSVSRRFYLEWPEHSVQHSTSSIIYSKIKSVIYERRLRTKSTLHPWNIAFLSQSLNGKRKIIKELFLKEKLMVKSSNFDMQTSFHRSLFVIYHERVISRRTIHVITIFHSHLNASSTLIERPKNRTDRNWKWLVRYFHWFFLS